MDGGGLVGDGGAQLVQIAPGDLVEAVDHRAEALDQLLLLGGGDRRERAAVEGALDRDDPPAPLVAGLVMVLAGQLDRAFPVLDAGIREANAIGKEWSGE